MEVLTIPDLMAFLAKVETLTLIFQVSIGQNSMSVPDNCMRLQSVLEVR